MTASLTRNGKGKASAGRCIFWPTFPQRQPRRISNFVPHAGVHSVDPNTSSSPAGFPYIFLPQGTHSHPGLVALPGSGASLETPVAASLVVAPPVRTGQPCRRALSPELGRGGISLHLFRCSGKHAAQHFAKSLGSVAPSIIGFAHVSNMRESHAELVASAYVNPRG